MGRDEDRAERLRQREQQVKVNPDARFALAPGYGDDETTSQISIHSDDQSPEPTKGDNL